MKIRVGVKNIGDPIGGPIFDNIDLEYVGNQALLCSGFCAIEWFVQHHWHYYCKKFNKKHLMITIVNSIKYVNFTIKHTWTPK